jgi:hypothetical protein
MNEAAQANPPNSSVAGAEISMVSVTWADAAWVACAVVLIIPVCGNRFHGRSSLPRLAIVAAKSRPAGLAW